MLLHRYCTAQYPVPVDYDFVQLRKCPCKKTAVLCSVGCWSATLSYDTIGELDLSTPTQAWYWCPPYLVCIYWFSLSHSLSSPCFVLAAVVVTQIRVHIACASHPPPHCTAPALHILSREDFSRFFPRQLAPNCTYPRSQEMIPFFFWEFTLSPRWDSNCRINAIITDGIRG